MQLDGPKELSSEFKFTLDRLENTNESFFITGRAGTGKSTLLKLFKSTTRKNTVILAPTGIAALNVGGQTIHSFFGFAPKLLNRSDIKKRRNHYMYRKIDTIIIDEISMVRADMLDNIDYSLQINRGIPQPFGGVQMIFFGDLFQLPPVIASDFERQYFRQNYSSPYFFSSKIIESGFPIEMIELRQVYRQEERRFINLLDAIRLRHFDYDDLMELNERYEPEFENDDFYITLSTRNATVNKINQDKLASLNSVEERFLASVTGNFAPKLFPTQAVLILKLGAQVMFVKNDPQKRFVNGTIGKVVDLGLDYLKVAIQDDHENETIIDVEQLEWEILKYDFDEEEGKIKTKVTGTFKQYPLKLAWAITIHKSQGKTFDKVIIDLGSGAFEYGQTYVALSRCRTMDGIVLKRKIQPKDIMVDSQIIEYYNTQL